MDIRHANTLSRTLSKCKQVFIQELGLGWIDPAGWIKGFGIGKKVLVVMHYPGTHANNGLDSC